MLIVAAMPLGCAKDRDAIALPRAEAAPAVSASKNSPAAASPAKSSEGPKSTAGEGEAAKGAGDTLTSGGGSILTGTTRPSRASNLGPQVSGVLLRVLVKEGDRIRKGQALVHLDQSDFKLRIRQAKAARNTARTQLAAVKIQWKRFHKLLKSKAIPLSDFDKVDAQFKLAQAGVAQAEVAVAMASSALAKTTIRAPFNAVVTRKMLDEGAYATVMPPSPVLRVEELDRLEVHIAVPESEMKRVEQGTPVKLHFRAIQKTVKAKISRVIPSLSPMTRSFSAIVVLQNPKHELRPGMFVEVTMGGRAQ